MSKKFIGYTGPVPRPTGNTFEGLRKSLEQDEKLYVEEEGSMSKKFIGYTGPLPKPTGNEFDGLKKSLEQDEKLYVEEEV